jgi:hypothetical protein
MTLVKGVVVACPWHWPELRRERLTASKATGKAAGTKRQRWTDWDSMRCVLGVK